jgi:hypothetical protein
MLALCVDLDNQIRQRHLAPISDLFQAVPEGVVNGHARLATAKGD